MTERHPTLQLGAFVLELLEPGERVEVEDHLRHCRTCTLEVEELQSLPPMLRQLSLEDVAGLTTPEDDRPDDFYARVRDAVTNSGPVPALTRRPSARPRKLSLRPRLVAAAAAVTLACVGIGLGTWAIVAGHPGASETVSADHAGVSMRIALAAATSRTVLQIRVAGLPVGEQCTLIAVARDGSRHPAGHWVATYSGTATVTSSTEVPLGQLKMLQLLGTHGEVLVNAHV